MLAIIPIIIFIGLAIGLTWFFLAHEHSKKEPIGALWAALGMGLFGAIVAIILENYLLPKDLLTAGAHNLTLTLMMAALGVGIIEEICKFLPLALFIYKKSYFNEHIDGVIYFAIAGLGFGLPENILYTIQYGASTGLARLIMTPFFHSALTAIVGYFLIKVKIDHKPKMSVVIALLVAIILHGFYDLGLFTQNGILVVLSLTITFCVTAMLFVLFMKGSEIDVAEGLAIEDPNHPFCSHCGKPNPNHQKYCVYCGKRV